MSLRKEEEASQMKKMKMRMKKREKGQAGVPRWRHPVT